MRSPRASNFLYLVMGALSVAIVATVLVASGVFDRQNAGAHASATATATPAATSSTSAAVPTDVSDIYRSVSPGVVYIASTTSQGQASGSGWVYSSDGTIVTNDHVVEGATKVSVRFTENGDPIDAQVVGTDPSTDIAVLKIDPTKVEGGVKPLQLADSKQIEPGQPAIAIGSPFGLQGTVTSGIVSALDREIQAPNGFTISGVIQTDAAINPGNSGGPLLDDAGPRDRHQLPDRHQRLRRELRGGLRRPDRHRQAGRPAAEVRRQHRPRLARRLDLRRGPARRRRGPAGDRRAGPEGRPAPAAT